MKSCEMLHENIEISDSDGSIHQSDSDEILEDCGTYIMIFYMILKIIH